MFYKIEDHKVSGCCACIDSHAGMRPVYTDFNKAVLWKSRTTFWAEQATRFLTWDKP